MRQEFKFKIEGIGFYCYKDSKGFDFIRDGSPCQIWDYEIENGYANIKNRFELRYDLELKNNLRLYRKALEKVKTLAFFL